MPRYFLKLSFKGTHYAGWQIQKNAVTVQQQINNSLSTILSLKIVTTGCGRTDTGVHAKQFFLHFDAPSELDSSEKIVHQLNSILPHDIAVQELIRVEDSQHARFDAVLRTYEYFISTTKNPFLKDFTMFCYKVPDTSAMNLACRYLLSRQDFSAFSKSNTQVKTNICTINEARWDGRNNLLVFTISADRFLRGMVRAIVGTLLEIGNHKMEPEALKRVIESKNRSQAGVTVPAEGLYLSDIRYPYLSSTTNIIFPG